MPTGRPDQPHLTVATPSVTQSSSNSSQPPKMRRFSAVLPDTNGAVWIGTLGGGLLRFDHGRFTRCQQENGLPVVGGSDVIEVRFDRAVDGPHPFEVRIEFLDIERAFVGLGNEQYALFTERNSLVGRVTGQRKFNPLHSLGENRRAEDAQEE